MHVSLNWLNNYTGLSKKKSLEEIYRVLKPGVVAYVGLYSGQGFNFIMLKLKAFLNGKFSKDDVAQYVNENTEGDWITDDDNKNPKTDLFSKSECERMFNQFSRVNVRKNGARWFQIPKIGKYIEKVRPKNFPPGIAGFGLGSNYITAIK